MQDETLPHESRKKLKEINSKLLSHLTDLNIEKMLPVWIEHIEKGGRVKCGPGRTVEFFLLILDPKQMKELVREYAKYLRNEIMGSSYNLHDLKDAVKWVIDHELIGKQKAIMHGLPEQFWGYLAALTEKAYQIVTEGLSKREDYRDDFETDEKTGELLEATIINLNEEDESNKDLDEKLWLDSLDSQKREIWYDLKAGYGVRHTAKKLKINKNQVARKRKELEKDKRKKLEEDENKIT